MNQAQNTPLQATESLSAISCAVMYAGGELMLAIPARENRFPVQITSTTFPLVAWTSLDGVQEYIELVGESGPEDHRNIVQQLQAEELLVAEVGDISEPERSIARHWLVGAGPAEAMKERAR